jgi:DNA-binding SARP family transcriptional activator
VQDLHDDDKATGAPDTGDGKNLAGEDCGPTNAKKATVAPDSGDEDTTGGPTLTRPPSPEEFSDKAGQPATAASVPARARVRVLGRHPEILNKPAGELVRTEAIELMVYLAVHTDGAHPDQITEDMWMGVRGRLASTRLHTAASNLRKLLAGSVPDVAAGPADFVVKQHGRYRLNPDLVEVDLWQLRAAHTLARTAGADEQRAGHLREVIDLYVGDLAAEEAYDWIERHRQGVLNLAIDAHTALATMLADDDPAQAAQILHAAADHDPLNEDVAQQAMRVQHRLGDPDAIRAVLRRLSLALDEIGAQPTAETAELADQLRRDLIRPTS